MMMRIGHGYDIHRFEDTPTKQAIILGGVTIPYEKGLVAHSDGDVVIHAVCDALLGACALGDIGKHFPDTSPEFKNCNSRDL
jgi:2-C-methyl-D-erythritol 2,4-cyclodiphosphate synthase